MAVPAVTPKIEWFCDWIARQYFAPGLEHQDLVQEARIGVWRAQRTFDPSRGEWERFAKMAAKRQVITAIKTATRGKHRSLNTAASYDEPITDDGNLTLADCLPASTDVALECESRERVGCLVQALSLGLSELEVDVLRHRIAGDDYASTGADLGVNHKCVDNALQRIRRKAQSALDGYDGIAA